EGDGEGECDGSVAVIAVDAYILSPWDDRRRGRCHRVVPRAKAYCGCGSGSGCARAGRGWGTRHDRQSACLDPAAPPSYSAAAHHYCRLPTWCVDGGGSAARATVVEAGACAPGIGVRVVQKGLIAGPAYHVELAAYGRARHVGRSERRRRSLAPGVGVDVVDV